MRRDVTERLERSLESFYLGVFIDCVHIKIYRKHSVDTEAFYIILAIKEDKTGEVLGLYNKPTGSALGQGEMLNDLCHKGVSRIGLETCLPHGRHELYHGTDWDKWQQFCAKWGKYYRSIRRRGKDASSKAYLCYNNRFTTLAY